jgi:hypothetical protein
MKYILAFVDKLECDIDKWKTSGANEKFASAR